MIILALDLGTKTGWAIGWASDELYAGTELLATSSELKADKKSRADRRDDCRMTHFSGWLRNTIDLWSPSIIVFEDVRFGISLAQVQLWASFRGCLWACCSEYPPGIRLDCLNTAALKKWATGSGAADKDAMAAALVRKELKEFTSMPGGVLRRSSKQFLDENAVDAIHLLRWAQSIYEK